MSKTPPATFFGLGNPMNAVLTNSYTEGGTASVPQT